MVTEKINIQDNCIRIPKKGDLLSYMYLMRFSKATGVAAPWDSSIVNTWKLYIGQELIDTQDSVFSLSVAPQILARTYGRSTIQDGAMFCPVQFWFCNDLPLPLVALQYDDVTIRIDWSPDPAYYYECYFNYVLLDQEERMWFAETAHEISIYQVQKLNNTRDIILRNPVNYIVSEPIKLPTYYTYGITINGKDLRKPFNSHGAQVTQTSEYARILPASQDVYPPVAMTADSQSVVTPYSVGIYTISVSSNTVSTFAHNLHDGDPSTAWTTPGQFGTATYTVTAKSNVANAWKVFAATPNIWVSNLLSYSGYDPTISGLYVASSTSDYSNSWTPFDFNPQTYWTSNTLYGNIRSEYNNNLLLMSGSSNLITGTEYLAVDGNARTYWSTPPSYYMDTLGTYTMNVSASNTLIQSAYDGNSSTYWESNSYGSYGLTTQQGTYTCNGSSNNASAYFAFDPTTSSSEWISAPGYGAYVNLTSTFTVSASSNLSPGNEYRMCDGNPSTSWSSNNVLGTYGYSTFYGNYASNASSNSGNSYGVWSSKPTFGNTWSGTYSLGPAYPVSNWAAGTTWISSNIYGYAIPAGTFGSNASANSNPSSAFQNWTSGPFYGKVINGSFVFLGSVADQNEYYPFSVISSVPWSPPTSYGYPIPPASGPTKTSATQSSITVQYPSSANALGYVITTGTSTTRNVFTSATVSGLAAGTQYNVSVTPWNITGPGTTTSNSYWTVCATPVVTVYSTDYQSASVTWGAVSGATVYAANIFNYGTNTSIGTASGSSVIFSSLASASKYSANLIVQNNDGDVTTSAPQTLWTVPDYPTYFTIASATLTSMNLQWGPPPGTVTDYTISGDVSVNGISTNTYILTGLSAGSFYNLNLQANNAGGLGRLTSLTAFTLCNYPSSFTLYSPSTDSMSFNWTLAYGGIGYTINCVELGTSISPGPSDTFAVFTGLSNATAYTFNIQTLNGNYVLGPKSSDLIVPTLANPPLSVTQSATSTSVLYFTWAAVPTVTSYSVNVPRSYYVATNVLSVNDLSYDTTYSCTIQCGTYYPNIVGTNLQFGPVSSTFTVVSAPGPVTQVQFVTSDTSITANWAGTPTSTSYTVTLKSSTGTVLATQTVATTTCTFTGRTAATTYIVDIQTKSPVGIGPVVTNTTGTGPVAITASTLTQSQGTQTSFTVSWTAASGATSYQVTCGSQTITTASTTASFSSLTAGTQYNVAVTSIGNYTGGTTTKAFYTTPAAVTGLAVQSYTTSPSITIAWTASPNATSYTVNGVNSTTSTSYQVIGLSYATQYTFTVTAVNSAGTGGTSSIIATTVPGAVTATSIVQTQAQTPDTQLALNWTAVNGATGYQVTYGAQTITTTSTSASISGLTAGTQYAISVAATNSGGTGQNTTSTASPFRTAASGGLIAGPITISSVKYYIHAFVSSGTFGGTSKACDCLLVGGGGGGGFPDGGGGGAGRLVYASAQTISSATAVTVGSGGVAYFGSGQYAGQSGGASSIGTLTAPGGGGGGSGFTSNAALAGGSGGGAGAKTNTNTSVTGGSATAGNPTGLGNAGGSTGATANSQGSGGGGAAAAGGAGTVGAAGVGGAGSNLAGTTSISSIFGFGLGLYPYSFGQSTSGDYYFAGGGGGGYTTPGQGGIGGGGNGSGYGTVGTSGQANTGGGGGGAGAGGTAASSGGSGIVLIRYQA